MTLWCHVPGRTLEDSASSLPAGARRLDTGEWVTDVDTWSAACGWWDADAPGFPAGPVEARRLNAAERAALIAQVQARRTRRTDGEQWADRLVLYADRAQDKAVDHLERFGDGAEGVPGFPVIGANWPSTASAQMIVVQRILTWSLHRDFVTAHMLRVLVEVLREVVRDSDVTLPPPLELG